MGLNKKYRTLRAEKQKAQQVCDDAISNCITDAGTKLLEDCELIVRTCPALFGFLKVCI